MEELFSCAKYLYDKYLRDYKIGMDEMKMHKLLYLAQRESFIRSKTPLFKEVFYAWKFGPILKEIRTVYQSEAPFDSFTKSIFISEGAKTLLNDIYGYYSCKNSWSLSRLTHGEFSWQHARMALQEDPSAECRISNTDIMQDARRIEIRRELFGHN